jgi:hypothetical protein
MKRYLIFLFGIVLFSCTKIKVDNPNFSVTAETVTVNVGDTVTFKFAGNPENIVFYSGEPGFNYTHRNRTTGEGEAQLNFTSYLQNAGEANTLVLLAATDFKGSADSAGIVDATWTDITSRATLSTGTDKTPSGTIDLTDFQALHKPVYFAFRYQGYNHATLKQPTWTIRTFNVLNVLPDGKISTNASIDKVGWAAYSFKNETVKWSIPATGGVITINGTASGSIRDDNEDWVITRGFDLDEVTPDAGLSIRSLSTVPVTGYNYIYTKPGTYTATFVAFNNSVDEQKTVVREVTITVQ